ncbi:MGMT family protein [Endozoicomonadaceae bacterium StTr2]
MRIDNMRERIWLVVSQIPCGQVATYGQIAKLAGLPGQARAVGQILSQLPKGSGLPWHRVINSQGRISFPVDSPRFTRQKEKLETEGIEFNDDRISLSQWRWSGEI